MLPDHTFGTLRTEDAFTPRKPSISSDEIAGHVADFLARGGTITEVDATANHNYLRPLKRTRREQIDYNRRIYRVKRNAD